MRRRKSEDLSNILECFFAGRDDLRKNYYEYKLRSSYFKVAGEHLMPYVKNLRIEKRVLIVESRSPAFRHELMMQGEALTQDLNHYVGASVIDKILYQ